MPNISHKKSLINKLTSTISNLLSKTKTQAILIFIITFAIYIHNLSPSVYGGDSGDFLSAIVTKGVPHPSGYPLYVILGIISNKIISFGVSPAWKVGIVSVLFSSFSITSLYLLTIELTKNKLISIATSLTLAFTFPFWLYAEVAEVMSMHYFFIIIIIYFTTRYINTLNRKYLYLTALLTGLSLTNNESIILLLPGVGVSMLIANKKLIIDIKTILKCVGFFILGLIPYIYIPLAATQNPLINTGAAMTINNLIYLITRQYYTWNTPQATDITNFSLFWLNFKAYINYWITYLNLIVLIFSLLGLLYLFTKKLFKILSLLLIALLFLGPVFIFASGIYLMNFGNFAVFEKFSTQSIIVSIILFPLGIIFIKDLSMKYLTNRKLRLIVELSILIIAFINPISFLITNWSKTNLSTTFVGNRFAFDTLTPLESNSIVFLQDDSLSYSSLYVKYGLKFRSDIQIPGLHDGFDTVLRANGLQNAEAIKYKIDHKNNLNDINFFNKALPKLIAQNNVYSDWTMNLISNKYGKILFVPYGLLYKLYFDSEFTLSEDEYTAIINKVISQYHLNDLIQQDYIISEHLYLSHIRRLYALRLFEISKFIHERYNNPNTAKKYMELALIVDPTIPR
jgi:hypothetical protein